MYTDDAETFLLQKARENGSVVETEAPESLFEGDKVYPVTDNYSPALDEKDYGYFSQVALALEAAIFKYDPRIVAVDHLYLSYDIETQSIRNTLGLDCKSSSNFLSIYASSRSVADGQTKTGYRVWCDRDINHLDIDALAREAAEDSLEKLGAAPIPSGKYSVILDARASADLLAAYCGIFSAESVQKGFSLLAGRLGDRIASELIDLRDDALLPSSVYSYAFDSEGVAAFNKSLIEKGVLTSFLHNRKTAAIDGVSPTGNGFRSGYKDR
jgi:PmbA protein